MKIFFLLIFLVSNAFLKAQDVDTNSWKSLELRAINTTTDVLSSNSINDIKQRYQLGADALSQIMASTGNVNQVLLVFYTSHSVSMGTNPWSDEDFRNWADGLENWGTSLGLVAAGIVAFAVKDESDKGLGLSISLLASSASKFIGLFFGNQTGASFEDKANFIEMTRRAYNELDQERQIINSYIQSNNTLIKQIQIFKVDIYDKAKADSDKQLQALAESEAFLGQFDQVLLQIPTVIKLLRESVERYCPGAIDKARTDPNRLGSFECIYHHSGGAQHILNGQSKQKFLDAAQAVLTLEEQATAANSIRLLTPKLRAALLGLPVYSK